MPDAVLPTQALGDQVALAPAAPMFQVATAPVISMLQPPAPLNQAESTQSVVLKTAKHTGSIEVAFTSTCALILNMNKGIQIEPESMQALPVFSSSADSLRLDFKLKVESSGQALSIQQVVTGSSASQPDMSQPASSPLTLKLGGESGSSAEFEVSTVDSALVIQPTNAAGMELLAINPNLVIGASLVEGKSDSPDTFGKVSSVVISAKKGGQ